jgi:ABC-type molybdenum transport system ATPase subunit/photorepair protein PhrA
VTLARILLICSFGARAISVGERESGCDETCRSFNCMIAACGVRRFFGDFAAVREIDLEIASGSTLALLGRNGAGKTTLLRMLAARENSAATALAAPAQGARGVPQLPRTICSDRRLSQREHIYEMPTAQPSG